MLRPERLLRIERLLGDFVTLILAFGVEPRRRLMLFRPAGLGGLKLLFLELLFLKPGFVKLLFLEPAFVKLLFLEPGFLRPPFLGFEKLPLVELFLGFVKLPLVELFLGFVKLLPMELPPMELPRLELPPLELPPLELPLRKLGGPRLLVAKLPFDKPLTLLLRDPFGFFLPLTFGLKNWLPPLNTLDFFLGFADLGFEKLGFLKPPMLLADFAGARTIRPMG